MGRMQAAERCRTSDETRRKTAGDARVSDWLVRMYDRGEVGEMRGQNNVRRGLIVLKP
jgi:hypothetical protein